MKALLKSLIDYNSWANQQVWTCVESLTEEQFKQAHDYSTGSVYEQLFHLMSTDYFTLKMLDGTMATTDPSDYPKKEAYPTREAIWNKWQEIDQATHVWFDSADVETLEGEIGFQETEDLLIAGSRAEWVAVLENHTTNHRAQILALIHQLGGETCEMGLYFYLRDRAMKKLETV